MSGNADDPLLSVAGKISSGEPVDWNELQDQIATPDQAAVAAELRSLERYARANDTIPAAWGRFQIIEQIGVGTFGVVYRAIDPTLQVEVAGREIPDAVDVAVRVVFHGGFGQHRPVVFFDDDADRPSAGGPYAEVRARS
jgi:hypothetical protein